MPKSIIETITNILYPQVNIEYLNNYNFDKFKEIEYTHTGDCCFDLRCCNEEPINLSPNQSVLISTGIKIQLPSNNFFELQIRPRSGIASKHQVIILNSPGTVDSHYRGEIKVGLYNLGTDSFVINYGNRIAQAKVAFVPTPVFTTVSKLNETVRGTSGFGSSGIH